MTDEKVIATEDIYEDNPRGGKKLVARAGMEVPTAKAVEIGLVENKAVQAADEDKDLNDLTVKQLKAMAEERGLDHTGLTKKDQFVDLLEQADDDPAED